VKIPFAAVLVATAVHAADLHVPADFPTIQAAIDAALPGDTVVIAAGTYFERPRLAKAVSLRGAPGAATVLDGSPGGPSPLFLVDVASDQPFEVRDLTVRGSTDNGAVVVRSAGLAMRHCVFEHNSGVYGAGLVPSQTVATFSDCLFRNNSSFNGGAVNTDRAAPRFERCVFRNNHATNAGTAFIESQAQSTIVDCVFEGNTGPSGAVYAWDHSTTTLIGNLFCGNSQNQPGSGFVSQVIVGPGNEFAATCDDCDGDGETDRGEILLGTDVDLDGDGFPDGCTCFGDFNRDGLVAAEDLSILLDAWGKAGAANAFADLTGDGAIDGQDVAILLSVWGPCG